MVEKLIINYCYSITLFLQEDIDFLLQRRAELMRLMLNFQDKDNGLVQYMSRSDLIG